jgi:hypothetical protein
LLLKPKVIKKSTPTKTTAKRLWPWFSFIFVAAWVFLPGTIFADSTCVQPNGGKQTCDLGEITVQVDTLINGQLGNFTTSGAADGSFTFEVRVTLVAPSSITFDTDASRAASSTQITIQGKQAPNGTSNRLLGAGVTATPVANSSVCGSQTVSNIGYTNCSNPPFDQNKLLPNTTIQAGQVIIDQTYTVDHTQFAKLGITQQVNGTDLTTGINQFYVYANLGVGYSNAFWNTLTGNGKNILVQLYANQSQATTATQNNQQPPACSAGQNASTSTPSCVPGYGGAVGSATNPQKVNTPSLGDQLAQFINQLIGDILALIQMVIYGIFANLIAPIIVAVLSIHAYQDSFVAVIYSGWETIRNLCDIFFIVALIIIAMATLFRVESYKTRHLLVQLIIAALLVNFSLVIGQSILAVADTVQAQFLPANVTAVNSLAKQLMTTNNSAISAWFRDTSVTSTSNAVNSSLFGGTFASLVWFALSLGTFFVFLAIAAFLVIRIVVLWLLLMISPVAYAVGVLPSTAQYRDKWWQEFLKYAFFTPIMAFFLNMTAIMATNAQTNKILAAAASSAGITSSASFANLVITISSNVLLLAFLIVSLKVATMAGVYGAEGITKFAKAGIFAPFKGAEFLGKGAGGWAKKQYDKGTSELANGGWLARQAFKVLHPAAFVKGVREEGKKERELYKSRVEAGATEVARKQFGWRRKTESPMFLFDEHKGKELYEEEEGEWSDNEQQVIGIGNRLAKDAMKGDLRARVKLKHWFTEAFRHKNLNEAMEGDNGLAQNLFGQKLNYNSNNIRYFFQELTKKGVIDENFTGEFLKKLSKDGYEIGDFNGVELVYSDEKTGHPHMIEMEEKLNPDGSHTGDAMPVGWNEYVTTREGFINQADTLGRAEVARKLAAGVPPEQVSLDVEVTKQLKLLEDPWAEEHHNYANAMHAERARRYMKINVSKRNGANQVSMFHDSVVNVGVEDGRVRISDAGTEVLGHMDMGKMYAMGRDNMPAKTRDKFMQYVNTVVADPARGVQRIEDDLTAIIKNKYRENGVKLDPAELKKEVEEQRNFWLASGYSILSSKPGAGVADDYFKGKTLDQTRDELVRDIRAYNP